MESKEENKMKIISEELIQAIHHDDIDIMNLLLEKGADINATNERDYTPLMEAVAWRCKGATQLLLEKGANPNARDNNGWTSLMEATTSNYPEIEDLLRQHGATV